MKRYNDHPALMNPSLRRFAVAFAVIFFMAVYGISVLIGASDGNSIRLVHENGPVQAAEQTDDESQTVKLAKPIHSSPVPSASDALPSVGQALSNERSAMTKGKLAILGIRSAENLESLRLPDDSFLVLIPTVRRNAKSSEPLPAERPPILSPRGGEEVDSEEIPARSVRNSAESDENLADSKDRLFVCLINHLPEDEKDLLADATDGKWDHLSFLDAVLIADGISDQERQTCRQIYDRHLARLHAEIDGAVHDLDKARIVYEFLHRDILTGSYSLNHSSAAVSLQTGVYNCVSATALFNALAGDVGLTFYGLEMTGHAKSRVVCGDHYLDIETTCPKWELLPDKPVPIARPENVVRPNKQVTADDVSDGENGGAGPVHFIETTSRYPTDRDDAKRRTNSAANLDANGEIDVAGGDSTDKTGGATDENLPVDPERAIALAGRKPVRAVTPVQFVATIYYNRAVDYYQEGKFDLAIYAYLKAIAVDPNNKTVLGNFKATLNNLAIELASRNKNYIEAIRLTEQGLALDPDFDQFKANLPLYYRHWSDDLRRENRIEEARSVEARFQRSFPKSEGRVF